MIFQATLSNKSRPEYGATTFPIPSDQYDLTFCCQQVTKDDPAGTVSAGAGNGE